MGLGDELMGSGMARGAAARGKRIAFGDGRTILWHRNAHIVYRNNPNVAPPGCERDADIEWLAYHSSSRIYNKHVGNRWVWNYEFRPVAGEVFFDSEELTWADRCGRGFILIEPNVPHGKSVAPNKQWPVHRFDQVAQRLSADGFEICQFEYGKGHRVAGVRLIKTPNFRYALAALARAALYIGPEGGLHHGAAAVGIPAVVLFGGFVPVEVTGYSFHENISVGEACGSLRACAHCRRAMESISVDEVCERTNNILSRGIHC